MRTAWWFHHQSRLEWHRHRKGGCTSDVKMCISMEQPRTVLVAGVSSKIGGQQFHIQRVVETELWKQWKRMRQEQKGFKHMRRSGKKQALRRKANQRSFRPTILRSLQAMPKADLQLQELEAVQIQFLRVNKKEQC